MKHIQLYMLATFVFCMQQISAGEQSQEAFETERQAIIDSNIIKYSYLSDAFNFLQSQNLVDESFHDFLNNRLPHDKDEELEFGVVIDQAEGVLTANMRDIFIQTLENAITDHKKLNEFDSLIFAYVMQHKDDFMHGIVNLWLYEWSKTINDEDWTPLHRAAQYNSPEIIGMLINAGVDVNIQCKYGFTPLHCVSLDDNVEIAQILIDAGADLNRQNFIKRTPLHIAAGSEDQEIAYMLITAGADIHIQDINGQTPLHWTSNPPKNIEITHMLIDAGAHINQQDNRGNSPLLLMAQNGYAKRAHMLIVAGADVNIQDKDGQTPLHFAVLYNYQKIVHMLINAGADLNIEDNDGLIAEQGAKTFEIHTLFSQAHMHRESSCNIS